MKTGRSPHILDLRPKAPEVAVAEPARAPHRHLLRDLHRVRLRFAAHLHRGAHISRARRGRVGRRPICSGPKLRRLCFLLFGHWLGGGYPGAGLKPLGN
jgi:hypothetical protein